MAFSITEAARLASLQQTIEPQLILEIDGVSTIYGAVPILVPYKYGDPGISYGDIGLLYGATHELDDSASYISLQDGTTTSIRQSLNQDKGLVSSVSSMQIAMIDKNFDITRLITPGEIVEDILGRKCRVYFGFASTTYPEDFIILFRGIIDDIISGAGVIIFNISHPDQKKRQELFIAAETTLNGSITNISTTPIAVDDITNFIAPITGPSGSTDSELGFYIKVDDELIKYTGISGSTFTGITRGQLGTANVSHNDEAEVNSVFNLTGNVMDLALKFMLSGLNGPYQESVECTNFNNIGGGATVTDSIYFYGVDLEMRYGLKIGDFITTTGASNGANNVSLKEINNITITDTGSYIEITGVTFVEEIATSAVAAFRSQYDVWPTGCGCAMGGDEVDVDQHLFLQTVFAGGISYDIRLTDTVEGRNFLENDIYKPIAAFSLPRKSQASAGIHSAPIPLLDIRTIDSTNVKKADKLKLRRSITKNFYNTIITKFDEDIDGDFASGIITSSATSLAQIPVGVRAFTLIGRGFRTALGSGAIISTSNSRRLNRYKFGAEYIEQIEIFFKDGWNIEVGDIILLDATELQMSNTVDGGRTKSPKLFEVVNRSFNYKTGSIQLSVIDSGFSGSARYAVMGPASIIKTGLSTTQFIIEQSYRGRFGINEYLKWQKYNAPAIKVHNADFSNNSSSIISNISGNVITVSPALGFTPSAGDVMELDAYSTPQTDQAKLLHASMVDTATFADGGLQYSMF